MKRKMESCYLHSAKREVTTHVFSIPGMKFGARKESADQMARLECRPLPALSALLRLNESLAPRWERALMYQSGAIHVSAAECSEQPMRPWPVFWSSHPRPFLGLFGAFWLQVIELNDIPGHRRWPSDAICIKNSVVSAKRRVDGAASSNVRHERDVEDFCVLGLC